MYYVSTSVIFEINPICISICTVNGRYNSYVFVEIPQQVTNENAITLVYYLAQQKTVIPRVILRMG